MRVVDELAGTAVDSWTDDDGGATPPSGAASSGAASSGGGAGPGRGLDAVDLRARTDRETRGDLSRHPPRWVGTCDPLRDPRWGLVKRLGTAFGLCASAKPPSHPGPPDVRDGDMDRVRHAATGSRLIRSPLPMATGPLGRNRKTSLPPSMIGGTRTVWLCWTKMDADSSGRPLGPARWPSF